MKFPEVLPFKGDKVLAIGLLRLAKEKVAKGECIYLCSAVNAAAAKVLSNPNEVTDWIEDMLGVLGLVTQYRWFVNEADLKVKDLGVPEKRQTYKRMEREYRVAWAKHLISHLQNDTQLHRVPRPKDHHPD